jgi:hypothetical protein
MSREFFSKTVTLQGEAGVDDDAILAAMLIPPTPPPTTTTCLGGGADDDGAEKADTASIGRERKVRRTALIRRKAPIL